MKKMRNEKKQKEKQKEFCAATALVSNLAAN
jgi:hypothetical protein